MRYTEWDETQFQALGREKKGLDSRSTSSNEKIKVPCCMCLCMYSTVRSSDQIKKMVDGGAGPAAIQMKQKKANCGSLNGGAVAWAEE